MFHLFKPTYDHRNQPQVFINLNKIEAISCYETIKDKNKIFVIQLNFSTGGHSLRYKSEEDARAELSQILLKSGLSIEESNNLALNFLILDKSNEDQSSDKNKNPMQFLQAMMERN